MPTASTPLPYKIPTILTILATVFMDAWQLSAIAESGDRRAQARFYARVWDAFFSAVCLCAGGIIAFSPLLTGCSRRRATMTPGAISRSSRSR